MIRNTGEEVKEVRERRRRRKLKKVKEGRRGAEKGVKVLVRKKRGGERERHV